MKLPESVLRPNQTRAEQKPATLQNVARVPRRQERRKSDQDAGV
jgi:hypothetical protein